MRPWFSRNFLLVQLPDECHHRKNPDTATSWHYSVLSETSAPSTGVPRQQCPGQRRAWATSLLLLFLNFYEMGLVPKGFFTLPLYTLQIKNQCISISANHWATIQSTSFSCERDMAYSTASLNEANNLSCKGLCSSCTE